LTSSETFAAELCQLLKERSGEKLENEQNFPWLIVCGSYHGEGDQFCNQSLVVTGDGEPLCFKFGRRQHRKEWQVRKRHPYTVYRRDIAEDRHEKFGLNLHECCHEPRSFGNRIQVVETPIGRIWVAICVDFLKTAGELSSLQGIGLADWILVPSATPRTKDFENDAMRLANSVGAVTVLGNACWLLDYMESWKTGQAGLAYTPWRNWYKNDSHKIGRPNCTMKDIEWHRNGLEFSGQGVPDQSVTGDASCRLDCSECLWVLTVHRPTPMDTDG
jgi:hypothetical protein